jgi:hypothetical protein
MQKELVVRYIQLTKMKTMQNVPDSNGLGVLGALGQCSWRSTRALKNVLSGC